MIEYNSFMLDNGLRVIVHEDHSATLAVLNVLYDVGSKDETADKTGFAHLFEHLMFGGSLHVASYDEPLQKVGGENNAFTSPDVTNYYISVPPQNLETAFWLESDRMLSLSFQQSTLDVQKSVVIEEFKQRYLNQPYGDVWLHLRPLAYKKHPYQWATIGKEISHIEQATLEDVKSFFFSHYLPQNAILVLAGKVDTEKVKELAKKWFEPIETGKKAKRNLPQEDDITERSHKTITASVPASALYKAFRMPPRLHKDFFALDLAGDVLGRDKSSRLYQKLVKEKEMFNNISAYHTNSMDAGLLIVSGRITAGYTLEQAEQAVDEVINTFLTEGPTEEEMQKVKNQSESAMLFGDIDLLNRAFSLAYATLLGDTELVNTEKELVQTITADQVHEAAKIYLKPDRSAVLYYQAVDKSVS